ncbi:MAG: sulfite exporter TauE/SafE family protein [Cytophagales bacterium]|nr:MAG: sulfite exporter TauE/SafE family protein [Cytophagales bacterium]TAF60503.1 MAG: sulfite exporter TauE/SafE family protein [Cytophagales bacterium]
MEISGFALGVLIGVTLGLIGSGGSILAVPTLVYVVGVMPSLATTYSLFVVGISALVGCLKGFKDKLINYKLALFFGLPSLFSILVMRRFILPMLPQEFQVAGYAIPKDFLIMLVFSVLMLLASWSMIKSTNDSQESDESLINFLDIAIKGIAVGLLTGFVGVGGGFLIIPTLVFSAKLPMKNAVATSLIVIAGNALMGFLGSLKQSPIDWYFLLSFTLCAVLGIGVGMYLNSKLSHEKLKPAFGWFVLFTGIYIIVRETWHFWVA